MPLRVVRLQSRHPLVGLLVLLLALALLALVVVFGAVVAAGLAVVGGVVMAARRLAGRPPLPPAPVAPPTLDPAGEVFAAQPDDTRRLLPP
jgi:hypothetical protein